ncbi:histidine kinase [Nostoc commune]|nr:histidine kinase [Nostoc commune]
MGAGEAGEAGETRGDKGTRRLKSELATSVSPCPQCPMPNAPCPITNDQ